MKFEAALQIMLQSVDTLTIIEAVAYANRLNILLRRNGCTDEERKSGLELFERLTERIRILEITLEPVFSRTGWSH